MDEPKEASIKKIYADIFEQADKARMNRDPVIIGRGGKLVVPRCYHMKSEKFEKINQRITEQGRFVSPFRRGGAYWGLVEALAILGENKRHLFRDVKNKMQEIMSCDDLKDGRSGKNAWEKFVGRSSKNPENACDVTSKILQNVEVLQRLGGAHPYGFKLAQMKACIDVWKTNLDNEPGIFIQLRTSIEGEIIPINERRARRNTKGTWGNQVLILKKDDNKSLTEALSSLIIDDV